MKKRIAKIIMNKGVGVMSCLAICGVVPAYAVNHGTNNVLEEADNSNQSTQQRAWSERRMGVGRIDTVLGAGSVAKRGAWGERRMGVGRAEAQQLEVKAHEQIKNEPEIAVTERPKITEMVARPQVAVDARSGPKASVVEQARVGGVSFIAPESVPVKTLITSAAAEPEPKKIEAEPEASVNEVAKPSDATKKADKWRIAPINYGISGDVGYNYRKQNSGSAKTTAQFLSSNVNLTGSSFIWQPWFARVRGSLGFGFNKNITSGGDSSSRGVTGNLNLSVLPTSRYPFEGYMSRNNDHQFVERGIGSVYQTTSYGFTQRYRPRGEGPQVNLRYDHNLWKSTDQYKGEEDQLKLGMTHQYGAHSFDVEGNLTNIKRAGSQDSNLMRNMTGKHNFRSGAHLTVNNLASAMQNIYRANGLETNYTYSQYSSMAYWRPENKPLTVNGSVRLDQMTTESSINGAAQNKSTTANANVGANYEVTKRLRVNGNANVNMMQVSGEQVVTSSQALGAVYQPDAISFSGFNYTRSLSANASNTNNSTDNVQTVSVNPSHNLSRNMALGNGHLNMTANQSVSATHDTGTGNHVDLSHHGSLGWSASSSGMTTMLRMSASDSRAISGEKSVFQLLNFQANMNSSMGATSSWNGNFTMQASRQETAKTKNATTVTSSADLSYRQQRLFNVARLRFSSDLRISGDALGGTSGVDDTKSWENHLDYSIGRTQMRLTLRTSKVNKQDESLFWFSLARQF